MLADTDLADILKTLLGARWEEKDGHAVLYGSRSKDRDIDILLIQNDGFFVPSILIGQLDLVIMDSVSFIQSMRLLDPLVLEPVQTGSHILGDSITWDGLLSATRTAAPVRECVTHLALRSLRPNSSALEFWTDFVATERRENLAWAINNLAFSISYMSFSKFYNENGNTPTTMHFLATTGAMLVPAFWDDFMRAKETESLTHNIDFPRWHSK
jgi:hypothetical protein